MKYIGLILAMFLTLSLTSMPYGYYELVRYITTAFFAWMALQAYKQSNDSFTFIYVAIAVLFQPFIKIALSKDIWNVIDVLVAGWLVYLYIKDISSSKR